MADDEQPAAVRAQELEQPGAGVGVEVVGRLVEEEQVTAAEEDAHELDASPLTAGEGTEGDVEPVLAQADARRELAHLRLGCVPTGRLELLLRGPEALDVAARGILVHRHPQLLEPRLELVEPAPGEHVGHDRRVVGHRVATGVLGEVPGGAATADDPGPGRRGAAEHPQERGLPGAVATHQADLVARSHLQGRTVDDPLAPDLDHQVLHGQHGGAPGNCGRGGTIVARGPLPQARSLT